MNTGGPDFNAMLQRSMQAPAGQLQPQISELPRGPSPGMGEVEARLFKAHNGEAQLLIRALLQATRAYTALHPHRNCSRNSNNSNSNMAPTYWAEREAQRRRSPYSPSTYHRKPS